MHNDANIIFVGNNLLERKITQSNLLGLQIRTGKPKITVSGSVSSIVEVVQQGDGVRSLN
jgi:hypothetical protein